MAVQLCQAAPPGDKARGRCGKVRALGGDNRQLLEEKQKCLSQRTGSQGKDFISPIDFKSSFSSQTASYFFFALLLLDSHFPSDVRGCHAIQLFGDNQLSF